ncbi:MAG: DNA internalization-related competence protein ComEC/Rec2 [Candidatus Accumulibacter sp.]|jgi:competence protein ComEC|nr:DNA internalization-related competence protein ComEC/Rec2 [Accumulibacter sp.]
MRSAVPAFAAGILFLQWQAVLPGSAMVAALAAAGVIGLAAARRCAAKMPGASRAVLLGACALLGFAWAAWRAECRLADRLPEEWEVRDIRLTGVVAALPQRFERGERFAFDVETVETPGASVPRRILLSWYRARETAGEAADGAGEGEKAGRAAQVPHPGERWRFTVRLRRPHGNVNPHGFDYEAWLLERGVRATGAIRAREEMARLDEFAPRPAYAVERLRDRLRERFLGELPDAPYAGVLTALAIGDQRSIPAALWETFRRTGVTHLISISGLHVTMIAALCAILANALWRRSARLTLRLPAQKAAVAFGWLAALAYAVIAGFEVPAQRTLYMLSVVVLALWCGRGLGVIRTLLLALLAVLLIDPWAVLAVGFWLSFGCVAVLFFAGSARMGKSAEEEAGRARRWRRGLWQWGAAQWAVTIASLPLLLLFFQQFSLVSPLANAVAIPVVSFIITPLALIFVLLPWPPLLHADHWLLARLMDLLDYLAGWPVWQQAAPPSWTVPLALLGVAWLLLPRGFPARWLGLCLLLPVLATQPPRPPPGEAWIDVLDVGQGLAVLVRTEKRALLYDTGPRFGDVDAGQRIVAPFLRAAGVARLDALVVSHRDMDHAGGLEAMRAHGPIARFLSSMPGVGAEPCVAGQSWEWDGIRFAVLHPLARDYADERKPPNNMSCVLRVWNADAAVLLTGDIEAPDERRLIARVGGQLPSDALVAPHHGGRGSSSREFVAAVAPRHAIFSAGYRNRFGHPRAEVLERYAASRQWRTDRDGAIRLTLGKTVEASAWRAARPRYWHGR